MRRTSILMVVAMVALSACGNVADKVAERAAEKVTEKALEANSSSDGGDVSVDLGSDSEGINISGTDAETGDDVEIQMGAGEVPADFPMPLPDSGQVIDVSFFTVGDDTSYQVTLEIDPQDWSEILDFYTNWMNDQGMEVLSSDDAVVGTADDGTVASVAYDDYGEYGEVGLGWSP